MTEAVARPAPLSLRLTGSRRELLLGGACVLAAGVTVAMQPRTPVSFLGNAKLDDLLPAQFGAWRVVASSGFVLPPADQLRDAIYSQTVTRTYVNATGVEIMLLIAYNPAENGFVQIHRPEVCYPAGGFRLTQITEHTTQLAAGLAIPTRYIVAETPVRRENILYWTRLGEDFPRRWAEQRWAVFEQNLRGIIPDGMLFRVSSTNPQVDLTGLDAFVREFVQSLHGQMRRVLVGNL